MWEARVYLGFMKRERERGLGGEERRIEIGKIEGSIQQMKIEKREIN